MHRCSPLPSPPVEEEPLHRSLVLGQQQRHVAVCSSAGLPVLPRQVQVLRVLFPRHHLPQRFQYAVDLPHLVGVYFLVRLPAALYLEFVVHLVEQLLQRHIPGLFLFVCLCGPFLFLVHVLLPPAVQPVIHVRQHHPGQQRNPYPDHPPLRDVHFSCLVVSSPGLVQDIFITAALTYNDFSYFMYTLICKYDKNSNPFHSSFPLQSKLEIVFISILLRSNC